MTASNITSTSKNTRIVFRFLAVIAIFGLLSSTFPGSVHLALAQDVVTDEGAGSQRDEEGFGESEAKGDNLVVVEDLIEKGLITLSDDEQEPAYCAPITTATSSDPIDGTEEFLTIVAHKIICTNESQLPNWGMGGPDVTANTARDWVNTHDSCQLAGGWNFEWGPENSVDAGNDLVGPAGANWHTFGPTNAQGMAKVQLAALDIKHQSNLWFREVLKENFIPFTHRYDWAEPNINNVTAELYCGNDVKNYDNYDRIDDLELDSTRYCVAWNVPTTGTVVIKKLVAGVGSTTVPFVFNTSWTQTPLLLAHGEELTTTGLQPGTYSITESVPSGWNTPIITCTSDDQDNEIASAINLNQAEKVTCTFINSMTTTPTTTATTTDGGGTGGGNEGQDNYELNGYVWHDQNADNALDEEPRLAGWIVRAVNIENAEEVYTTTTDSAGYYVLNVPTGTWKISELTQEGWALLSEADGDGTYTVTVPAPTVVTFMDWIVTTAHAATLAQFGPYNFGNGLVTASPAPNGNGGGGGGTRVGNRTPAGRVLGETTSSTPVTDRVGGTSVIPVGAPNAGAGGTSSSDTSFFIPLVGLLSTTRGLKIKIK